MDASDFELWEAAHILATGANGTKLREVMEANRATFTNLHATYEELNECSQRILDSGEIPDYPDKHIAALMKNLHSLRAEREKRKGKGTYGGGAYSLKHPDGCDCPNCNGGEVLPSYEAKRRELTEARGKLQDWILANGGTLQADRIKRPRKGKK